MAATKSYRYDRVLLRFCRRSAPLTRRFHAIHPQAIASVLAVRLGGIAPPDVAAAVEQAKSSGLHVVLRAAPSSAASAAAGAPAPVQDGVTLTPGSQPPLCALLQTHLRTTVMDLQVRVSSCWEGEFLPATPSLCSQAAHESRRRLVSLTISVIRAVLRTATAGDSAVPGSLVPLLLFSGSSASAAASAAAAGAAPAAGAVRAGVPAGSVAALTLTLRDNARMYRQMALGGGKGGGGKARRAQAKGAAAAAPAAELHVAASAADDPLFLELLGLAADVIDCGEALLTALGGVPPASNASVSGAVAPAGPSAAPTLETPPLLADLSLLPLPPLGSAEPTAAAAPAPTAAAPPALAASAAEVASGAAAVTSVPAVIVVDDSGDEVAGDDEYAYNDGEGGDDDDEGDGGEDDDVGGDDDDGGEEDGGDGGGDDDADAEDDDMPPLPASVFPVPLGAASEHSTSALAQLAAMEASLTLEAAAQGLPYRPRPAPAAPSVSGRKRPYPSRGPQAVADVFLRASGGRVYD